MLAIYLSVIDRPEHKRLFRHIYRQYLGTMYEIALRILQNSEDAEDAVQDALIALARGAERLVPLDERAIRNYVASVSRNKAMDLLKQRIRQQKLEALQKEHSDHLAAEIPLDNIVAQAIARLPRELRELLVLRFSNGYTAAELARMYRISQSAVHKRLQKAKEALRKELLKEGITV